MISIQKTTIAIAAISLIMPSTAHAATLDIMMQSFHDQVQKMIDGLEAQITELQEKVDKWKSKAKSLEKQNEKLEAKIDSLQDGTFSADEAYQDLKAENKQLKKQLEKVRNIKESKKEQITDLNNTVSHLDGSQENQEAIAKAMESGSAFVMTDKKVYTLGDTVHVTGYFPIPQHTYTTTYVNGTTAYTYLQDFSIHAMKYGDNHGACYTWYPGNPDLANAINKTYGKWYSGFNNQPTCPLTINTDGTIHFSFDIPSDIIADTHWVAVQTNAIYDGPQRGILETFNSYHAEFEVIPAP